MTQKWDDEPLVMVSRKAGLDGQPPMRKHWSRLGNQKTKSIGVTAKLD